MCSGLGGLLGFGLALAFWQGETVRQTLENAVLAGAAGGFVGAFIACRISIGGVVAAGLNMRKVGRAFSALLLVYEVAIASYNRQRIFAWLGIGLTAIAAVAALAAWRKWSQVPAWPREMILSVVLVVLAGLLLLALWDTPVMVRSHPSRQPFANASHHRLSTSTVSIDAAFARTYHLFQTSTVSPSRLE